jgi:hypothetical protein
VQDSRKRHQAIHAGVVGAACNFYTVIISFGDTHIHHFPRPDGSVGVQQLQVVGDCNYAVVLPGAATGPASALAAYTWKACPVHHYRHH